MFSYHMRDLFDVVPEIDFNKGYNYYLHNMENYSKALLATLKSIRSKLPILRNMIETKEYEGLRMITQTLRRMMTTIGGEKIAEISYNLEYALLNEENGFNDLLMEYTATLEDLADRMEELVKRLPIKNFNTEHDNRISYFDYDFRRTKEFIEYTKDLENKKII
ncbi:MAG: Transposase [Lachnoclostridium sp.]|jgi:hypothetical protein